MGSLMCERLARFNAERAFRDVEEARARRRVEEEASGQTPLAGGTVVIRGELVYACDADDHGPDVCRPGLPGTAGKPR